MLTFTENSKNSGRSQLMRVGLWVGGTVIALVSLVGCGDSPTASQSPPSAAVSTPVPITNAPTSSASPSTAVVVPTLRGTNLTDAEAALTSLGLVPAAVDTSPAGRAIIAESNRAVVNQVPTGGATVTPGATVTLRVLKTGEPLTPPVKSTPQRTLTPTTPTSKPPRQLVSTAKPTPKPTRKTTAKPAPTTRPKPSPPKPTPTTQPPAEVYYPNCTAVRAAGAAPIHRGEPGYSTKLDRDGDGIACEN
jgi:hypothetical protein